MRVLLSTIGSRGDVQPLVALALQLKALGQEVRLCVPPDFRDWIEGLGIPVTPIGPEVRNADGRQPTGHAGPTLARAACVRRWRKARSPPNSRRSRRPPRAATSSWRQQPCRSPLARWPSGWESPTSSPPTARPFCHRHTTRHPRCARWERRRRPQRPTTASSGPRTHNAGTTLWAPRSTPIGHRCGLAPVS